jgi:hypothetical protein
MIFQIGTAPNTEAFWDFSTYIHSQFPALADLSIAGYAQLASNTSQNGVFYGGCQGVFFIPALSSSNTTDSLAAAFNPIFTHVEETWPGQFVSGISNRTYPSFNDFFLETSGPNEAGIDLKIGSRLLDAKALSADLPALKSALKVAMGGPGGSIMSHLVSGKGVRDAVPRGGSNSVNPAWRKSLVHASTSLPSLSKSSF